MEHGLQHAMTKDEYLAKKAELIRTANEIGVIVGFDKVKSLIHLVRVTDRAAIAFWDAPTLDPNE